MLPKVSIYSSVSASDRQGKIGQNRTCNCKFAQFCRIPEDDEDIQERLHKQYGLIGDDLLRWKFQHRNEEIRLPKEETIYDQIKIINILLNEIEYVTEMPIQEYLEYHSGHLRLTINQVLNHLIEKEATRKRRAEDMKAFLVH